MSSFSTLTYGRKWTRWKSIPRHTVPCRNQIPKLVCPPGDRQEAKHDCFTSSFDGKKINSTAKPRIKCVLTDFCTLVFPSFLGKSGCKKSSSLLKKINKKEAYPIKVVSLSLSITERKRRSRIKVLLLLLRDKTMFSDCYIVTVQTVWLVWKYEKCEIVPSSTLLTDTAAWQPKIQETNC